MSDAFKAWLETQSLGHLYDNLVEHGVDLDVLGDLSRDDLSEMGLTLGDRKRLQRSIDALEPPAVDATQPSGLDAIPTQPRVEAPSSEERRNLTLVFIDLVGSTQLANDLDLEQYREILHRYQTSCLNAIRRRHGYVAQFLGDGIVAYFGYPTADESDAERAVIASLDIIDSLKNVTAAPAEALHVRIGIATGDVLINDIADGTSLAPGLALGDTPNLAARLQTAADTDTIAIGIGTKQLLGTDFRCRSIGARTFKGFDEPMEVWIVEAHEDAPLRYMSRRSSNQLPLINRSDEMMVLRARWRASQVGEGQTVLLAGEAGIGKSRLVEAIAEDIHASRGRTFSLQCSPYREGSALLPVSQFLRLAARLSRDDPPGRMREKLVRLLRAWRVRDAETHAVFADLLGIPGDGSDVASGDAAQNKTRLQTALLEIVKRFSDSRPLAIIVEDLHWIDPSTEELLELLIERAPDLRLFIVCTYRPGYQPQWTGRVNVTSLMISRLNKRHTREMVGATADVRDLALPPRLEAEIIDRTDGVPLYIEEMTRMVRQRFATMTDAYADEEALRLPTTLKDLLRAKIDSLGRGKELVAICATLGRTVSFAVLQAVVDRPPDAIVEGMQALVDADVLVPRGGRNDRSYLFRHALIQEAAYETLLASRARELHGRIGDVLKGEFPEIAAANPELVANHFTKAKRPQEAREAWRAAATLAAARSATEETIRNLEAALRVNKDDSDEPSRRAAEIEIRKQLSVALHLRAFGGVEHLANFERLDELMRESDRPVDPDERFLTLHSLFGMQLMLGQPEKARVYCDELTSIAENGKDHALLTLAAHDRGMAAFMAGEFADAIAELRAAIAESEGADSAEIAKFYAADIRLVDRAMIAWAEALRSPDDESVARRLSDLADEAADYEHAFSRCYLLSILAAAEAARDDAKRCREIARQALELSEGSAFQYWAAWSVILGGWASARLGEAEKGINDLNKGIEAYLASGSSQIVLLARTLLADAYFSAGRLAEAMKVLAEVKEEEAFYSVRFQAPMTDALEAKLKAAGE